MYRVCAEILPTVLFQTGLLGEVIQINASHWSGIQIWRIVSMAVAMVLDISLVPSQRIKLAAECFSEWGSVPSGVPQGTKLGPWLFVLMINDLEIAYPLWKYVDDTTASETVPKEGESHTQSIADCVIEWSRENRVHLNSDKCKEFRI